jgi:hypothetical protein
MTKTWQHLPEIHRTIITEMVNFDLNFCSNFYSTFTFNVTKCTAITIKLLIKEVRLEHSLPLLQVNNGNSAKAHCQKLWKVITIQFFLKTFILYITVGYGEKMEHGI